jgi:ABC-2 type transport system permease protein
MSKDALPAAGDGFEGVLSRHGRPAAASAFSAVVTLGWRAMLKIKHIPFQLFDVTVMPIMFTLLFTSMFGKALGGSINDYIQLLVPGILVQTVVFITVYTGVGLNSDIQKGLFDRFRSMPIWQPAPIFGALAGDLFRYSVASTMVIVLGLILGFRPQGGPLGVLAAFALVLVFCFSVSWIWIIIGMKVKTPESVMTTSFIFLMPLTFMSNIFVQLDQLPGWLRNVVEQNPVTHLASASRGLMHGQATIDGHSVWVDVLWVLGESALLTLVFAPLAMRMYRKER